MYSRHHFSYGGLPRAFLKMAEKMAYKNSTEPAIHLSKLSYYENDFVTAESVALETRR